MAPRNNNSRIKGVINQNRVVRSSQSPEYLMYRSNDLVPIAGDNDGATEDNNSLGRGTLYEPVLLMSPVYASRRNNSNRRRGLITAADVNDLTQALGAMVVGGCETATDDKQDNGPSSSGRYDDKVFSKKAKGEVTVKRSMRHKK